MKTLKTSHLALTGLVCILLLNGENLRNSSARTEAVKGRKDSHREHVKLEKERARNALDLSKIALDRYRQNCIFVTDLKAQKESYFQPGTAVVDTALNRPVREGAPICNKLGDTAIVTNGVIENIAAIAVEDWDAFAAILKRRGYKPSKPKS